MVSFRKRSADRRFLSSQGHRRVRDKVNRVIKGIMAGPLHTDVLADVRVRMDSFCGTGGLLYGSIAAEKRGKMKPVLLGAIGLILIGSCCSAPRRIRS
jgi:hypothetical protein